MSKLKKKKKFDFEKKKPRGEKLPATRRRQETDARQKAADEGLEKSNFYLIIMACVMGGILLALTIWKNSI